jgi:hypothetical protein
MCAVVAEVVFLSGMSLRKEAHTQKGDDAELP